MTETFHPGSRLPIEGGEMPPQRVPLPPAVPETIPLAEQPERAVPDDVERIVQLFAAAMRERLLRPEYLSKPAWVNATLKDLIGRYQESLGETHAPVATVWNGLMFGKGRPDLEGVLHETVKVAALAAMMNDPRRRTKP